MKKINNNQIGVYIMEDNATNIKIIKNKLLHYLKFKGGIDIKLVTGYIDSKNSTKAFEKMIKDVKKGKINKIIVERMSTIGDSRKEINEFIEGIVLKYEVGFVSLYEGIDTDRQGGRNFLLSWLHN